MPTPKKLSYRVGTVLKIDHERGIITASGFTREDVSKAVSIGITRTPGRIITLEIRKGKPDLALIKVQGYFAASMIQEFDDVTIEPSYENIVDDAKPEKKDRYECPRYTFVRSKKPAYNTMHIVDRTPDKFDVFPDKKIFTDVIKLSQEKLLTYCTAFLRSHGYELENMASTKDYLYAKGNIPVLLIAHLDTVHKNPVSTIYIHKDDKYLIAKEGIGGDDRCGVYVILRIIQEQYNPHVLFTTDEECGGIGATAASIELKAPDVRCMIEIDRRGKNDCVFYDNDNAEFKRYIESFGFKEATGSFSDISILGPAWNIASVNLSGGYYAPHTLEEKIQADEMMETISKVIEILERPPVGNLVHVKSKYVQPKYVKYKKHDWYGETKKSEVTIKVDQISKVDLDRCVSCINSLIDAGIISEFYFSNPNSLPSKYGYDTPFVLLTKEFQAAGGEQSDKLYTVYVGILEKSPKMNRTIREFVPDKADSIFNCIKHIVKIYYRKFARVEVERAYREFWEKEEAKIAGDRGPQVKQSHLEKSYNCMKTIASLPFVQAIAPKSTNEEFINKKTPFPFFSVIGESQTYYITELVKKGSRINELMKSAINEKDRKIIQSCVDFLVTMYKTFYNFDELLMNYVTKRAIRTDQGEP